MKTFFIVISLCFSLNLFALTGSGYDVGNGGLVIVCKHSEQESPYSSWITIVDRIQFYDLWYWSKEGVASAKFQYRSDIIDVDDGIELVLSEFTEFFPRYRSDIVREYFRIRTYVDRAISEYNRGLIYNRLERTRDYGDRAKPSWSCPNSDEGRGVLENIASYNDRGYFSIVIEYYFALTPIERVAFLFHETIYKVLDIYGLDKGEAFNTMEVTAIMISTESNASKFERLSRIFN